MSEDSPISTNQQLASNITIRQASPGDAAAIHALLRPYVAQRLLLDRTEAELIELTRHGFIAIRDSNQDDPDASRGQCVGFAAIEVYSPKLAELQSLAVHHDHRRDGVGRALVMRCIERARDLGIMEILAISSSDEFLHSCGFDYALPDQRKALFCQLRPRHPEC